MGSDPVTRAIAGGTGGAGSLPTFAPSFAATARPESRYRRKQDRRWTQSREAL